MIPLEEIAELGFETVCATTTGFFHGLGNWDILVFLGYLIGTNYLFSKTVWKKKINSYLNEDTIDLAFAALEYAKLKKLKRGEILNYTREDYRNELYSDELMKRRVKHIGASCIGYGLGFYIGSNIRNLSY